VPRRRIDTRLLAPGMQEHSPRHAPDLVIVRCARERHPCSDARCGAGALASAAEFRWRMRGALPFWHRCEDGCFAHEAALDSDLVTTRRTRIAIVLVVFILSGGFIAAGAIVTNKQWETALITIGCELLLFVPLTFLEPRLTRPLRRAEAAARGAQQTATEVGTRLEAIELSNEAIGHAAEEAARRAAERRSSEEQAARRALDLDPTTLASLLAEGVWTGTLSNDGLFAVIPAASKAPRYWYLRLLDVGEEDAVGLRLLRGHHEVSTAKLSDRSSAAAAVERLRDAATRENRGAPPSERALLASLETIVSLIVDVRLKQTDRQFPFRNLRGAIARGWALDWAGRLVSVESDSKPQQVAGRGRRLAFRLEGVPKDVLRAASALLELWPKAI
jgi:hypothetical protein